MYVDLLRPTAMTANAVNKLVSQANGPENQDFDFSSVGGFFKAKKIVYRQKQKQQVSWLADDDTVAGGEGAAEERIFENFIEIGGSKWLIGRNLALMASVLVTDTISTLKKKLSRGTGNQGQMGTSSKPTAKPPLLTADQPADPRSNNYKRRPP